MAFNAVKPFLRDNRWTLALQAVSLGLSCLLLFFMVRLVGSAISGVNADITADWLVRAAVRDGVDPAVGLRELGRRYGVAYLGEGEHEVPVVGRLHPRTPGALVLMTPLLLVGSGEVFSVWNVVNGLAIAALMAVSVIVVGRERWPLAMAMLPLVPAMLPVWRGLEFATHTATLAVATWVFVIATRHRDRFWPGLLLGGVIAMRLFPALMLFPAFRWGRWRAAGTAVIVALLLTLGGLAFSTVGLSESVGLLQASTGQWAAFSFNTSLAKGLTELGLQPGVSSAVSISVGLGTAIALMITVRRYDLALTAVLIVSVLTSPLSWSHYDLFLMPGAFLVFWTAKSRRGRILSAASLAIWVAGGVVASLGGSAWAGGLAFEFAVRGVLLAAIVAEGMHRSGEVSPTRAYVATLQRRLSGDG